MKKSICIVMFALLVLSFSSAINIEKQPVNNLIIPQYDRPAEFTLTITNATAGRYNIYTLTDVTIFPMEYFNIVSGENTIPIEIFPLQSLNARGTYTFVYYLRDSSGVNYEDKITTRIVDLNDVIEIYSESNYPGEEMFFYIKNKESAEIKDLTVHFKSIFFEFTENFNLDSKEIKRFNVSVDSEKLKNIPAGAYLLEAVFETDSGDVNIQGKITLGEQKGIDTQQESKGFFIKTDSVTKSNSGNTIETVKITLSRGLIASAFTFFSETPLESNREGLQNIYSWSKQLGPGEVFVVSARTNYLIPFLILFITVLTIVLFRRYNVATIDVKKSVSHVKTKGGEFALRVRLHLKVRKNVENISIIEKIPALVKVHENFGTLKPSSINTQERRIQWNLGDLQAGEERMLSYIVYSKVGVVGKFSLPGATVVFEENGNISETFSNQVYFLSEQVKK